MKRRYYYLKEPTDEEVDLHRKAEEIIYGYNDEKPKYPDNFPCGEDDFDPPDYIYIDKF